MPIRAYIVLTPRRASGILFKSTHLSTISHLALQTWVYGIPHSFTVKLRFINNTNKWKVQSLSCEGCAYAMQAGLSYRKYEHTAPWRLWYVHSGMSGIREPSIDGCLYFITRSKSMEMASSFVMPLFREVNDFSSPYCEQPTQ